MIAHALFLAGLAATATANIYTTTPITANTVVGGQPFPIRWQDSRDLPSAASFGPTLIDLWAGSDTNQTFVFNLGTVTDPLAINTLQGFIPPEVTPNGLYFIRYTSINQRDAAGVPLLAFSPRFTLAGMTGVNVPQATVNPVLLTASANIPTPISSVDTAPVVVTRTSTSTSLPVASRSGVVLAASASASKKSGSGRVEAVGGVMALSAIAAVVAVAL